MSTANRALPLRIRLSVLPIAMMCGLGLCVLTLAWGAQAAVLAGAPQSSAKDDTSIRPFEVHVPQAQLDDLKKRIEATRWVDQEIDATQGVPLATMQSLLKYWSDGYDWRKLETKLNALPQYVTTIDGVDIQFIHVRSREPNALPLLLTHGWPGSPLEFLGAIGPLTDPVAHGGRAEDAFDVVIPAIPGYGFSGRPTEAG